MTIRKRLSRLRARRGLALWMSLPVPVLLAGCGGGYAAYGPSTSMTCVPYARAVTGLPISGNAASWWDAARGRFIETDVPAPGAVLVFRRTGQLPSGHLAVISSVLSARRLLVTQANWLPYRITSNQPVLDVSPANNWTAVRVWWPPINGWGSTVYPTYGFILSGPGNAVSPGASPPLVQAATPAWRTGS